MNEQNVGSEPKRSAAEKAVFWVGSLCGILVAMFTVFEKVTAPSDARLGLTFFESSSDTLNLFPSVDTSRDHTGDIPLQLRVENKGGRVAKNMKLYISHYRNVELTARYKKEDKRTWNSPNDAMNQVSLTLEDLNPGEFFLIPITIKLDFPKDLQRAIRSPRETVADKTLLMPRAYPIYCDLSSDTSPNMRVILQVVLGHFDVFREQNKDIFWLGHGKDGMQVLKAKDDFLNPAQQLIPADGAARRR